MTVNLSIKNVPEALAARLRARAGRNHRSLQGELMAILESAVVDSGGEQARAADAGYAAGAVRADSSGGLLDRLLAIAGERGTDIANRLTREQAHDRRQLRKSGI